MGCLSIDPVHDTKMVGTNYITENPAARNPEYHFVSSFNREKSGLCLHRAAHAKDHMT